MVKFYCEKCQRTFNLCNSTILGLCICYSEKVDTSLHHKNCLECWEGEICECCGGITKRNYRQYIEIELEKCSC